MEIIEFEGRWKEPQGTPKGELVWLPPGKGGLQTHVATVDVEDQEVPRQVSNRRDEEKIMNLAQREIAWERVFTLPTAS